MTAINTVVLPERIHIFTDGSVYNEDGVLSAITGKTAVIPSYPGAVATRGAAMGAAVFAEMFAMYCPTFDDLVERIEDVYPEIRDGIGSQFFGGRDVGQMFIAGWSNDRQRCEAYFISGNDNHLHSADGESGSGAIRPEVGKLERMTTATTLPALRAGDVQRGWHRPPTSDADADRDIDDYALTTLQLQRSHRHMDDPLTGGIGVQIGGAAFVTTITKDGVTSRCIHRWQEDQIGDVITPAPIDWEAWRDRKNASPNVVGLSRLQRERMEKKARKGTR